MRDFSIENSSDKIYSEKTKEYFQEVIKSYYSESYRSAIVMLYSITITDLLFKLNELKEIHNDKKAIEILGVVSKLQLTNPTSPEWERKLIELVNKKTNLLEPADHLNLENLQKLRHLCAHPVLTKEYDLYKPNRETTKAQLRNTLEGILTKPPLFSKDILSDMLENLSKVKDVFYKDDELKRHISSHYLKKINASVEKSIFRSLWKITFKLDNEQARENRDVNLKALIIIMEENYREYKNVISGETDYYSDFNEEYLIQLVSFLNQFPEVFSNLNESAQILINSTIRKDADLETQSWFITGDIKEHMKLILNNTEDSTKEYESYWISSQTILAIYKHSIAEGYEKEASKFIIKMFGNSDNYDMADSRFDQLIFPNLTNFSKSQLRLLVKVIEDNSQIHGRRDAKQTNRFVRDQINVVYDNSFDYGKFHSFNNSIK